MELPDQEFCLKWNNHQSTLVSVLDRLLNNQTLVDITLAAEGQTLKAHKLVLSACSPFFHDLLATYTGRDMVVFLKDVRFAELQALVDYMYKGEVSIAQNNLASLIQTAESLKIKGLAEPDDLRKKAPPPPLQKINLNSSQSPKNETKKTNFDQPASVTQGNSGANCSFKRRKVEVPDFSASETENFEAEEPNGVEEVNIATKPKSEASFSGEDEWSESELVGAQEGEDSQGQWHSGEDTPSSFPSDSQVDQLGSCVYPCTQCDKRYRRRDSLARHAKYECGGRRMFSCEYCGRSFTQRTNVKKHVLAIHLSKPGSGHSALGDDPGEHGEAYPVVDL